MRSTEEEARRDKLGIDELIEAARERGDDESAEGLIKQFGQPNKILSDSPSNYPQQGSSQPYRNKLLPFKGKQFPVGFLLDAHDVGLKPEDITYLVMMEAHKTNNEDIFAQMASPYRDEKKTPPLPPATIDLVVRESVNKLMEAKDANGKYIVTKKYHWIAIFWTIVGRQIGIADYQYGAFTRRFKDSGWETCRIPYNEENIANCTRGDFKGRVETWVCSKSDTKRVNIFNQMKRVAEEFDSLLTSFGLPKP